MTRRIFVAALVVTALLLQGCSTYHRQSTGSNVYRPLPAVIGELPG
jgi:hypothetical protein